MENPLIPVFSASTDALQADQPMCNARDLHSALKVDTRFNDWIARRIDEYGFVENVDFWTFDYSSLSNQKKRRGGDRRSIDYHLTLDMAKELAMIENNEVGRQVRLNLHRQLRQVNDALGIPTDPLDEIAGNLLTHRED